MTIDNLFVLIGESSIQQVPKRGSSQEAIWREIEVSHMKATYSKEECLKRGVSEQEYELISTDIKEIYLEKIK